MQLASVVPLALLGTDGPMRNQLESLLEHRIGQITGIGLLGPDCLDAVGRQGRRQASESSRDSVRGRAPCSGPSTGSPPAH
jgi:hypothetical protein